MTVTLKQYVAHRHRQLAKTRFWNIIGNDGLSKAKLVVKLLEVITHANATSKHFQSKP